LVPNHLVTADVTRYPATVRSYADLLRGRSMMVIRAEMVPVECVVRGYISGSAWKEYKASGRVCGIDLPKGLKESDELPEPICTPATKDTTGHDENMPSAEMTRLIGPELSRELRDVSWKTYTKGVGVYRKSGTCMTEQKV